MGLGSDLRAWAAAHGVEVRWPRDYLGATSFRDSPCLDFGKFLHRVPAFVLRPADQDQLGLCLRYLWERQVPYRVRGSGHGSGGRVLIDAPGAVLDIGRLGRVVADDPAREEVTAEGGCQWLDLVAHLHPQGRRPPVLTDNLRTTLAGTLSVGGAGDTSLHYGLQITTVTGLSLWTPDGARHELRPGDELFQAALGGCGQFGVLGVVRLRTLRRPAVVRARHLRWRSLERFLADALRARAQGVCEFFRAAFQFSGEGGGEPGSVHAIAGDFAGAAGAAGPMPDAGLLEADEAEPLPPAERFALAQRDPGEDWDYYCPAVEGLLPLPHGLRTAAGLLRRVADAGLARHLPTGCALAVLPTDGRFPAAPLPAAPLCLLLAVRPQLRTMAQVDRWLPLLRDLGAQILDAGGRIYPISVAPSHARFLELQYGEHLPALRALRARLDPADLCNGGWLSQP